MDSLVVFLAFANNRDSYLETLNRERKSLTRALRPLESSGAITLEVEASASLDDIFDVFREYDDRIAVFHFAGHAGGRQILLEKADASGQAARAEGLAPLLGRQKNLKLVVLNGCATYEQVKMLFDAGVKAVIATTSPIEDRMATEFAEQFYLFLSYHNTVQRAFETAKNFVFSLYGEQAGLAIYRDISAFEKEASFPWGLYLNQDDEAAQWSLPRHTAAGMPAPITAAGPETGINDILISAICLDLVQFSPDLSFELSKEKEERNESSIKRAVVDAFPTPIGEELRKLVCKNDQEEGRGKLELFTVERLAQLEQTYRTSVQFIFFLLLSQLWDEKHKNPKLKIGADYFAELNSFFSLRADSFPTFDYVRPVRSIMAFFDEQQIACFIPELKQVDWGDSGTGEIPRAISFFDDLNQELLQQHVEAEKLRELCLDAETHLGAFLKTFSFLAKYKLAAIKNIEIIKTRHEAALFRHNQITLDKALTVATLGMHPRDIVLNNFTDNKCVLLMKTSGNEVRDYLSLSPFIIDKNSLVNEKNAKLYLYAFQQDDAYVFHFLNNHADPWLVVDNRQYDEIFRQFEKFKAELFGYIRKGSPATPAEV